MLQIKKGVDAISEWGKALGSLVEFNEFDMFEGDGEDGKLPPGIIDYDYSGSR